MRAAERVASSPADAGNARLSVTRAAAVPSIMARRMAVMEGTSYLLKDAVYTLFLRSGGLSSAIILLEADADHSARTAGTRRLRTRGRDLDLRHSGGTRGRALGPLGPLGPRTGFASLLALRAAAPRRVLVGLARRCLRLLALLGLVGLGIGDAAITLGMLAARAGERADAVGFALQAGHQLVRDGDVAARLALLRQVALNGVLGGVAEAAILAAGEAAEALQLALRGDHLVARVDGGRRLGGRRRQRGDMRGAGRRWRLTLTCKRRSGRWKR